MTAPQILLLTLSGVVGSTLIVIASFWVLVKLRFFGASVNNQEFDLLTDLERSLKETQERERFLIDDVEELKEKIDYLHTVVESLARQLRDAGLVPEVPSSQKL